MTSKVSKDIAMGAIVLTGAVLVIVAAEVSAPLLAGVGAGAALSAGVYQALSAPPRKRSTSKTHPDAIQNERVNRSKVAGGF
jgi:hypothetical protein